MNLLHQIVLDTIYEETDRLFTDGKPMVLDMLLPALNVAVLPTDILIGVLTATLPGKSLLPSRPEFLAVVERTIRDRGEWLPNLLDGLA